MHRTRRGGLRAQTTVAIPRRLNRFIAFALVALCTLAVHAASKEDASRPRDGVDLAARLADAPVIVLARCIDVEVKAKLQVEEALRGSDLPPVLTIAFRSLNLGRVSGEPPFKLEAGQRAVFALAPWTDSRGDTVKAGVYQPLGGYGGKIPIPAEGGQALLDAVRQIVAYQDGSDPTAGADVLATWLGTTNPWLVELALAEAARLGIADAGMAPALLAHVQDASPRRRSHAVEALGIALARGHLHDRRGRGALDEGDSLDLARAARETIIRVARTDADATVRRVAVHELGRGAIAEAGEILSAIGRDDPSQEVRYEAAASLADLARAGRTGS